MLSWRIFRRAIMLIVDDLGAALRITALPYAIFAGVSLWFVGTLDIGALARMEAGGTAAALPPGVAAGLLATALAQLAAFLWISVAWHRHVLLREGPAGWIPPLEGRLMLGYLGRSLLIGIVVMAVVVMVSVALVPLAPALAFALAAILAMVFVYRLGLILPAGAIGKPLNVVDAWRATIGQSGTVVLLAVLTYAATRLLQLPSLLDAGPDAAAAPDRAAPGGGVIGMAYDLVATWMLLMLGVSVLSTLYGHFVEGRPLD